MVACYLEFCVQCFVLSAPQMVLFPCAGALNHSEGVSSWISQYRGRGKGLCVRVRVHVCVRVRGVCVCGVCTHR